MLSVFKETIAPCLAINLPPSFKCSLSIIINFLVLSISKTKMSRTWRYLQLTSIQRRKFSLKPLLRVKWEKRHLRAKIQYAFINIYLCKYVMENDEVWECIFISWWFDSIWNSVRKKRRINLLRLIARLATSRPQEFFSQRSELFRPRSGQASDEVRRGRLVSL